MHTFVQPKKHTIPVGVALLPPSARLGLCNQLNAMLCFIIANHKTPYRKIVIQGFKPHLFEDATCFASTLLDLEYANEVLSSFDMPTILDDVPSNSNAVNISQLSDKIYHISVNALPEQYSYLYSAIRPAKNIRDLATLRLPSGVKEFDAVILKFGVDEITHYLGTVGGESLPNYGTLVHGSDNMKQQMLNDFNAWAKSDHGVKCLNKYADDAIMFINRHYECNRPIYICTAVGKDSRHDMMIPYIERVMNAVPCLMWNRDIPDERREICAMIDLWICVASEVHHDYPGGSTLSHVASCIKQGAIGQSLQVGG